MILFLFYTSNIYTSDIFTSDIFSSDIFTSDIFTSDIFTSDIFTSDIFSSDIFTPSQNFLSLRVRRLFLKSWFYKSLSNTWRGRYTTLNHGHQGISV